MFPIMFCTSVYITLDDYLIVKRLENENKTLVR